MINLWVCVCVQGGGSFLSQQMAKEIKSYRKLTIKIKAREAMHLYMRVDETNVRITV